MLFDNNDFGLMSYMSMPKQNKKGLYSVEEGFMKGNMFKDEYKPYKNYKVRELIATNEKDKKLYKIMAICFAIDDLNLFLDLNPNDPEKLNMFKTLVKEKENLEKEYASVYGPLTLSQVSGNTFNWVSDFPWEKKGDGMYV